VKTQDDIDVHIGDISMVCWCMCKIYFSQK